METILAAKLAMAHLVCRAGFREESDRSFTAELHLRTGCRILSPVHSNLCFRSDSSDLGRETSVEDALMAHATHS